MLIYDKAGNIVGGLGENPRPPLLGIIFAISLVVFTLFLAPGLVLNAVLGVTAITGLTWLASTIFWFLLGLVGCGWQAWWQAYQLPGLTHPEGSRDYQLYMRYEEVQGRRHGLYQRGESPWHFCDVCGVKSGGPMPFLGDQIKLPAKDFFYKDLRVCAACAKQEEQVLARWHAS
jgi:hypothetical protein